MKRHIGCRTWAFPDGELPPAGGAAPFGHESLILLNPNPSPATITVTVYFETREPERDIVLTLGGERVCSVRLDQPLGERGFVIPPGQYALIVESTESVVAQIGRMDVRQPNLAYYTVLGFAAHGEPTA
jgi:hypothetical protein